MQQTQAAKGKVEGSGKVLRPDGTVKTEQKGDKR